MSEELEALAAEVLEDLKREAGQIWDDLTDEHKPIVEQAAKNLAHFTMRYIAEPENRARHQQNLAHIRGTLESAAALAQIRTAQRLRESLLRVLSKSATTALSILI